MFTLIEARNYRCLRYLRQTLGSFQVLVGPNASGKTTFLDVISFLHDLASDGLDDAIARRASRLHELFWSHSGDHFELAVEVEVPMERLARLPDGEFRFFRYEVAIGVDPDTGENGIRSETGLLIKKPERVLEDRQYRMFPSDRVIPKTLLSPPRSKTMHVVFSKKPGQNDNFYPETRSEAGTGGWMPAFRLGSRRSTLANLPEDETRFPVATWFKELLCRGVQQFNFNSLLIRRASPPGQVRAFKPDGSNLPWLIHILEEKAPDRLKEWISHCQQALPDINGIRTVERAEDKHRYLVLRHRQGFDVPSWMASDGTLRLLALTLPAYLPGFTGVFLIEEPENGIHPRAVETLFQSLSSVYNAQILMATHSPVVLSKVKAQDVLCFAKTEDGATDIVAGHHHPRLKAWRGEENLGVLFAGGVLG